MRAVIIIACLLATACGVPVRKPAMEHILQQIQAQQRPQPQGSVSQESMQDLARVKNMLDQYARMFPPVNVPAVQPQNPMMQMPPLLLPSGVPLETPPQDPPTAAGAPQVELMGPDQQVAPNVTVRPDMRDDPLAQVDTMTQAPEPGTQVQDPAAPGEQAPQTAPQVILPVQPNPWAPQPGLQVLMPFQPNTPGAPATAQPTITAQMPQVFPSYGYFPFFPGNQQFPVYRIPLFFPATYPLTPAQTTDIAQTVQPVQPIQPVQPVLPAQTGQPQVPQIVYMAGPFGSASSEELQAAGPLGGFGMFLPGFGGGVPTAGVGPVLPVFPAGQGMDQGVVVDPAQPGAPPTSGGPLEPTVLPVGMEIPTSVDAATGDQSNRPTLGQTTPSVSSRIAPPLETVPHTDTDTTLSIGDAAMGTDTDLYP